MPSRRRQAGIRSPSLNIYTNDADMVNYQVIRLPISIGQLSSDKAADQHWNRIFNSSSKVRPPVASHAASHATESAGSRQEPVLNPAAVVP